MKHSKKKANERTERNDVFVVRPSALQKPETPQREPFSWQGDEQSLIEAQERFEAANKENHHEQ
jgi:hypothetical protein